MNDKHKELAKECYDFNGQEVLDAIAPMRPAAWRLIFEMAFRWYSDKYLADTLHAAVMIERERRGKETCEWMVVEKDGDGNPLSFKSTCGEWWHVHEDSVKHHDVCCPRCGRRIVEKKDAK